MEPVKIDQILRCSKCGVELKVISNCDSTCACSIVCCGQPLSFKDEPAESATT
ncbi:MAG: hypothetical protein HQ567_31435 [Candidatus Nealsonbacteria bacterium]|nr:hypothetical protein [Candidatus Nealsonbacteria bacterium]